MSTLTPLNESNFKPIDPFSVVLKAAEVLSIGFTSATGSFSSLQDVIGLVSGGVQQATFTIIYTDENKTKISSITKS